MTLRLYQDGMGVDEIASARDLAPSSIASHLAQAIEEGEEVDVAALVPADHLSRIETAFEEYGDAALRPVKDALDAQGEEISYTELHLARAARRRKRRG